MSNEQKLINRFFHRILVVGDYDWKDFDIINREIKFLNPPPEAPENGFQITGPRSLNEGEDQNTVEFLDDSEPTDDTLLVVFNARGASSMAKGIANSPSGTPDGWRVITGPNGTEHWVPNTPRSYSVPCLEINLKWSWAQAQFSSYDILNLIKELKPTKILNFDTSGNKSPAHRSLTQHVINNARSLEIPVSTIQR